MPSESNVELGKIVANLDAVEPRPPRRRFQFSLKTLFAYITWGLVTYSIVAWVAPNTGFGAMGPIFLVYLVSTAVLTALLWQSINGETMFVLRFIGAIIFVILFFVAEVQFLTFRLMSNPPPRPMFHNYFHGHERALLPYWHWTFPILDDAKNRMWADYEDNVLLAVVGGDQWWSWPAFGHDETRLFDRDDSSGKTVAIKRTTNQLLILSPDGTVGRFPLQPEVVQAYHEQRFNQSIVDLFADVGAILDSDTRRQMDAFLVSGDSP